MNWIEALILGLIQGLSEFLPISSSGHLEIGSVLLNLESGENLTFAILVHGATVLSTIVIFRKDIISLIAGFLEFRWNESTKYLVKIFISMIPVGIVGIFFTDTVESLFTGNLLLVGSMLLITATLLTFAYFANDKYKNIPYFHAFIIGIAQAFAVLPGISRAGATIATGLMLGNKREQVAKFSFLMVLIPIIGANLIDLLKMEATTETSISAGSLLVGFIAAFISGLFACKVMINVVKRGKLIYFAIYCLLIGLIAILAG